MSFESTVSVLMRSFSDLNNLATGGIYYRNLPTDREGNVDWGYNYIAWDCNKSSVTSSMGRNNPLFSTYSLVVVVNSSDTDDNFDSIISAVYNNLHNYSKGNILSISFESENKYTKLGDGMDGLYVSEQLFTVLYKD